MDASVAAVPRNPNRTRVLLYLCGALLLAGSAGVALIGDVREGNVAARVWAYEGIFAAEFLVFLAALWCVRALTRSGGQQPPITPALFNYVLLVALAARIVLLLFSWPNLSDDIRRYVWDGMVQQPRFALNPYLLKPDDAPDAVQETPIGQRVTHGQLPANYPPLTEHLFRLIFPVARNEWGYRAMFILFDWGTLAVLLGLLRRRGAPLWIVLYAWHPLVLNEFAGGGHFDSVAVFWMVLAVALLERRRGLGAWAVLAASVCTKFISGPLALFFWLRTRKWQIVAFFAVILLLYWWYLPAGYTGAVEDIHAAARGEEHTPHGTERIFKGLGQFMKTYSSNDGVRKAIAWIANEDKPNRKDPVTRISMAALLLALVFGLAIGRARLVTAGLFTIGGMIVLNRTVHPWYLTWLVPWLTLAAAEERFNRWFFAAWLSFTATVVSSYVCLIRFVPTAAAGEPVWVVPAWSYALQYVPLFGLLVVGAVVSRRTCSPRPTSDRSDGSDRSDTAGKPAG